MLSLLRRFAFAVRSQDKGLSPLAPLASEKWRWNEACPLMWFGVRGRRACLGDGLLPPYAYVYAS